MNFHSILCWLKGAFRSRSRLLDIEQPVVSGHEKKTQDIVDNVTVFIEECSCCGEITISWSHPGPMTEYYKKLNGFPHDEKLADQYEPVKAEDFL